MEQSQKVPISSSSSPSKHSNFIPALDISSSKSSSSVSLPSPASVHIYPMHPNMSPYHLRYTTHTTSPISHTLTTTTTSLNSSFTPELINSSSFHQPLVMIPRIYSDESLGSSLHPQHNPPPPQQQSYQPPLPPPLSTNSRMIHRLEMPIHPHTSTDLLPIEFLPVPSPGSLHSSISTSKPTSDGSGSVSQLTSHHHKSLSSENDHSLLDDNTISMNLQSMIGISSAMFPTLTTSTSLTSDQSLGSSTTSFPPLSDPEDSTLNPLKRSLPYGLRSLRSSSSTKLRSSSSSPLPTNTVSSTSNMVVNSTSNDTTNTNSESNRMITSRLRALETLRKKETDQAIVNTTTISTTSTSTSTPKLLSQMSWKKAEKNDEMDNMEENEEEKASIHWPMTSEASTRSYRRKKPIKTMKFPKPRRPCLVENCPSFATTKKGYCSNHGGRKLCTFVSESGIQCETAAVSHGLCVSHGGGKRCKVLHCVKGAQSQGLCVRHGGGKRCRLPGCSKGAQSGGLCVRHGGGRKCQIEGCTATAQSHQVCGKHGGGRQCNAVGCRSNAKAGGFCSRHGGGKRCEYEDCESSAVSLGFCVRHGGRKRCQAAGCETSAVSRGLCVKHGGGKRCTFEGCNKGAQSKGFCVKHGGGRRCKKVVSTSNETEDKRCSNPAIHNGLCLQHGGKRPCQSENCSLLAEGDLIQGKGYCSEHGGGIEDELPEEVYPEEATTHEQDHDMILDLSESPSISNDTSIMPPIGSSHPPPRPIKDKSAIQSISASISIPTTIATPTQPTALVSAIVSNGTDTSTTSKPSGLDSEPIQSTVPIFLQSQELSEFHMKVEQEETEETMDQSSDTVSPFAMSSTTLFTSDISSSPSPTVPQEDIEFALKVEQEEFILKVEKDLENGEEFFFV